MKKYIQFIKIYWRKLSAREQLIITVTLFVVIIMLWKSIFYQELYNNQIILQSELRRINNNISEVDKKIQLFKSDKDFDPDRENRRLLAVYAEESKRLDATLKESSNQIIPVQDMADLMTDVLKGQAGLKFISLENMPAVREVSDAKNPSFYGIEFYRHTVVLKVEGTYSSLFAYLKILESMPWNIYWQGIDIKIIEYPNALITLELYTLGFGQGVLGV